MTYFAKIEDGVVVNIIVAKQDFIDIQSVEYIQTTLNDGCQIHGTYKNGKFITVKPHRDYILIDSEWKPPTPKPLKDSQLYKYDSNIKGWVVNDRKEFKYNYSKHIWEKIGD